MPPAAPYRRTGAAPAKSSASTSGASRRQRDSPAFGCCSMTQTGGRASCGAYPDIARRIWQSGHLRRGGQWPRQAFRLAFDIRILKGGNFRHTPLRHLEAHPEPGEPLDGLSGRLDDRRQRARRRLAHQPADCSRKGGHPIPAAAAICATRAEDIQLRQKDIYDSKTLLNERLATKCRWFVAIGIFSAPCERTFQRVQVPNPPDSGKDIAEHQGCPS